MAMKISIALLACVSTAYAVQPIEIQGTDFVNSVTKDRFEIIGVAYQPGGSAGYIPSSGVDPLSNGTACLRDAAILQQLGANTIRVYNIDPAINHDECVSIFNEAGIYIFADVNSPLPNESIDAGAPWTSYDATYLERVFGIVEAFKNYPNTLGFFGGNELINDENSGNLDPPYIRAVTRDIKNYIAKHSSRAIPVGYSAADVRDILVDTFQYTSCLIDGSATDASRIDFFGLNSYSWCGGDATFQSSGYDVLTADFENATMPVFFSEYGCNKVEPRVFDEVQALYGSQMTPVMSGGLAYQYTQDVNDFGLVQINANSTVSLLVDFDNLQSQLNKINLKSVTGVVSPPATKPATCSSSLISSSTFNTNFTLLPEPPGVQDMIDNGISNPNNGKIISVTSTTVPMAVYASNGQPIKGLALKVLSDTDSNTPSGSNLTPNGTTTSGSSASGSGSAPSSSPTKNSGTRIEISMGALAALGGLAFWLL